MRKVILFAFLVVFLGVALLTFYITKNSKETKHENHKALLTLQGEGIRLNLYSEDGSLKVGKNRIFLELSPEGRLEGLYFYMPPMPGMGEMREDALLEEKGKGRYEGTVSISMAGSWQLIAKVDGKVLKRDLSIPLHTQQKTEKREEGISITPDKLQLIGIQSEEVKSIELMESFSTVGYASYDLSRTYEVTIRSDAWVLDTFGRFEGELIGAGTPLMRILSPEVEIAQAELRLSKEMGRKELEKLVQERLSYIKAGEVISSPYSGVIVERKVSPGGFIKAGDTAYRIADISKVWVIAEVPQEYAVSVKKGMKVMLSPVGSHESMYGKVEYIFPEADREARTIRVRIDLPRKDLKINQLFEVYFEMSLGKVLAVPESAVVDTGRRQVVFVEREPGLYEPRRVKLGRRAEGYYEVLEGLREGEKVVVKGTFLLDSEAQLRGLYGQEVKAHEHHH